MSANNSFWKKLQKPIIALAPMADVTDVAFRTMFERYGKPDVFWTEFVSADGLCSAGREILKVDLLFAPGQRPIVAQLFTSNPEHMYAAGCYVRDCGFDGIDINMGCPDRSIEKQGCGSAMIRDPVSAIAVIDAAKKTGLPVSVKTRLGYSKEEIDSWLPVLLRADIEALTVHLRTRKEMSLVDAHWECMERIVALRNELAPQTLLLGNGDVKTRKEAYMRCEETGCDGAMIGRGIFGNPWLFSKDVRAEDITHTERLRALIEHTRLFEELLPMKSFHIMKRHFKAYVYGFDGSKELRQRLMDEAQTAQDVEHIIGSVL